MATPRYLEQILFKEQSPGADQLFEERSETLFELGEENSYLDIHVQQSQPGERKSAANNENNRQDYHEDLSDVEFVPKHSSGAGSSEPPSPIDKCNYLSQDPPRYVEAQGLDLKSVCSSEELGKIASESTGCDRFCFIRQRHSYSRLQINRKLFETLLLKMEIFPRFKEFALLFGWKSEETEVGHPQLRFRTLTSHVADEGDRIIGGFECAYALRYVELTNRNTQRPWSLRQAAIYHRYDAKSHASTWVMISASPKMQTCLDRYVKSLRTFEGRNPFNLHALFFVTALANFRPFIIDLTRKINEQSDKVLVASIDDSENREQLDIEKRQMLKDVEDEILDMILVFDSMACTLVKLLKYYNGYRLKDTDLSPDDSNGFDCVGEALQEICDDIALHKKKVQTLHEKLKGTINLLSNILDLGNGSSLKQLAEEARYENISMRRLAEKTTQDAAAVKVLTIITLIYLPATVVSNFFSSQFVSTQVQDGVATTRLTSNAWLFAAISVPLTIFTITVWGAWIRVQVSLAKYNKRAPLSPLSAVWTPKPKIELYTSDES